MGDIVRHGIVGNRGLRKGWVVWAASRARLRLVTTLVAWVGASVALAFTPEDALTRTPASERSLRQEAAVAAAERALAASGTGTAVGLSLKPELGYGADVEDPAAFGAALELELDLAWHYDRSAILGDTIDLLYARERLRHWRRAEVADALRLHGKLLRAEVALRRAELELAAAKGFQRSRPSPAALERAQALIDARRHVLDALRADAARLGFAGPARFERIRFALPDPGTLPARRDRVRLELERAILDRDALPYDVLRDVSLDATYESSTYGYQVGASLVLDRGRPGAALNGQIGSQEDDQWSIALSARIRLDGADERARADAEERVRRAREALAVLDRDYPGDARRARVAVDDANAVLDAELAAWNEAWRAASASSHPSPRACRALLARENAVYGAWLGVVGAMDDYLERVDGSWALVDARSTSSGSTASPRATVAGVTAGRRPDMEVPGMAAPDRAAARQNLCLTGAP